MEDKDCVWFLQHVLPRLRMRWRGFRKVRKQVCKRIQRRISELGLADIDAYREYLISDEQEWPILDYACRVTVSRFYRDKLVMEHVRTEVLPALAERTMDTGDTLLRGWSAGCAMGEEAYSLVLIWDRSISMHFPQLDIAVIGSDIDERQLQRATDACYSYSSVKALPDAWLQSVFTHQDNQYCLDAHLRIKVRFIEQDIRENTIEGPFQIVFCRNMAFTYFDNALQLEVLEQIHDKLVDGGALVIGAHETLPDGYRGFERWSGLKAVFRKTVINDNEK